MWKFALLVTGISGLGAVGAAPLGPNDVAVLYNTSVPESVKLAGIYRDARKIPAANLIGLPMPAKPDISRAEYLATIQKPLRQEFESHGYWKRLTDANGITLPVSNKFRVLVTMRGVPLRIQPEPPPPKPKDAKDGKDAKEAPPNPIADRDDASVDSELAMFGVDGLPIKGVMENKYFRSEKSVTEANVPFLLLTARIDAANMATCERMIRDAVETEPAGLWGRAYVDIANKYPEGDRWLEAIVAENLKVGIPTVVDRFSDTFPKNYPMTEAALYYGWYDWNVSGPFLNPKFRFRKGAVAMHLHSFSADQLTDPNKNWSAPLLERGAAATIGNVYEPYLQLTHQFDILHQRLLGGFTFVEAAWMSIPEASWQAIVLGDPLYRPFLHFDCQGKRVKTDDEFLALRLAAIKWHDQPDELRNQLEGASERMKSGTISEAIGLRLVEAAKTSEAAVWFRNAREHFSKTEDKLRQDFNLIAIMRASPSGKIQAIQALRDAKVRYGQIPEAEALSGWLDILDPPPPPPADPAKIPPPSPQPVNPPSAKPPAKQPAKSPAKTKTPAKSNSR